MLVWLTVDEVLEAWDRAKTHFLTTVAATTTTLSEAPSLDAKA